MRSENLSRILNLLCCPDDGQPLRLAGAQLLCNGCGRDFPRHDDDAVELLPRRPASLHPSVSSEYRDAYLMLFRERFDQHSTGVAWGADETASESWMRKRRRQVVAILPVITEDADPSASVLCDIAAGAGHYTFAYQPYFRVVLHCDLSAQNLSYARRKAHERKLDNMFFLRIDYFQPPFRHSLDRLICLDTLIRGEEHESMLLKSIAGCLKPAGEAVVDFHNWWHNPLRRLGFLPDNFNGNRSYRRSETLNILRKAGFHQTIHFPFVQEFDPGSWLEQICSKAVPSTRIVYRVCRGPVSPSPSMCVAAHGAE